MEEKAFRSVTRSWPVTGSREVPGGRVPLSRVKEVPLAAKPSLS